MGVGRAFLFWAVFQKAYKVHIFHSAVELEQASGAAGCLAHAQPLQANITPMPPKIMMAKTHSIRVVMIFCFIGFFR
jgi:hypothetical protein